MAVCAQSGAPSY